jgi:hypothetical protein
MKMLTKELEKSIPPLYSQDDVSDPQVVLHYFVPWGAGDWFITEGQPEVFAVDDKDVESWLFYGFGGVPEPEMGYVALCELESITGPFGLKIERDLHWQPKPLSEVMR